MSDEERAAIRRLQAGDIGGLEYVVHRYQLFALRTAFGVLGDRQLAEDAAQAAFIAVFSRITAYDDGRRFGPWLGGIVVREAKRMAREREKDLPPPAREARGMGSLSELLQDELQSADKALEQVELRAMVGEALRKLSPTQRALIVERYYVDRPSALVGARATTARSQLRHARTKLRRWLVEGGILSAQSESK